MFAYKIDVPYLCVVKETNAISAFELENEHERLVSLKLAENQLP